MFGGRGPLAAAGGPGCHATGWLGPTGSGIRPIQPGTRIRIACRLTQTATPIASTTADATASFRIPSSRGLWQCARDERRKAMIAVYPTQEQIQALLAGPADRPVVM